MLNILMVGGPTGLLHNVCEALRSAGYAVLNVRTGREAFERLRSQPADLLLSDLSLSVLSGLEVLRQVNDQGIKSPVVLLTEAARVQDALDAIRLGAADGLQLPIAETDLLRAVEHALPCRAAVVEPDVPRNGLHLEAHAASRWARALIPVIEAERDLRTIEQWSRTVFAAPGTLRNWCRTAGVSPRRSLVLARLLRAAALNVGGRHRPENLLDVVDLRTLHGLLRLAGLDSVGDFPRDVDELLRKQTLVTDLDTVRELSRALEDRRQAMTRVSNRGARTMRSAPGSRMASQELSSKEYA